MYLNISNAPLVSIACITYNHEPYLRMCIDGFLLQKTSFPFEILIHDDASTDGSDQIIREYELKYPDLISPIYQIENQYSKGNKRILVKFVFPKCRGKYIALCEGDDYWTDPLKLQKQVDFLEANQEYALVWTDVDFYSQSTGTFKRSVFKNGMLTIFNSFNETLINKPFFAPPTWLFRREFIPVGIDEYCDGTFPMILDILAKSKIKYLDEVTATYRQLDESASNSKSSINRYKFLSGVYKIQKDYLKKYKIPNEIEKEIDFRHFKAAYPYAVFLNDKATIIKGKLFLQDYSRKDMKVKLTLFLSSFYLGILLLRVIYNNKYLKNILANLGIFR
jgi:glycosyltransferase involved in cell wall biosynthesis